MEDNKKFDRETKLQEGFLKIVWSSAPSPVESDCFLDPESFDIYCLPPVLKRVDLLKKYEECHSNDNKEPDTSTIEPVSAVVDETVRVQSPQKRKKKKKKKRKLDPHDDKDLHSTLTESEHQTYLKLMSTFGGRVCSEVTPEEKTQIELLAALHGRVVQEQQATNQYLKESAESRKASYHFMHPDVHKHVQERLIAKTERALNMYPGSFSIDRVLPLVSAKKEPKITTLTWLTQVLHQGKTMHAFVPNLKKEVIFLTVESGRVRQRFPVIKGDHPSQQVISADTTAMKLAEEHSCHIVCSFSALNTLLSGLLSPFEHNWDIPCHLKGGELPVLFMDKPLAQAQANSRYWSASYHKYAARLRLAKNNFPNGCKPKLKKMVEKTGKEKLPKDKVITKAQTKVKEMSLAPQPCGVRSTLQMDDMFGSTRDICDLETFGTVCKTTKVTSPRNLNKVKPPISSKVDQVRNDDIPSEKQVESGGASIVKEVVSELVDHVTYQDTDGDSDAMVIDIDTETLINEDKKKDSGDSDATVIDASDEIMNEEEEKASNGEQVEEDVYQDSPRSPDAVVECVAGSEGSLEIESYPAISYAILLLGELRILIRHKIHGTINGKPVCILPKMQYLSQFGFEEASAQELVQQWLSLLVHPTVTLLRVHVDSKTSQVQLIQKIHNPDQVLSGYNSNKFSPSRLLDQLHHILSTLVSLKSGQYLLTHRAQESVAHLYRNTDKRFGLNLHKELQERLQTIRSGKIYQRDIQFLPLDPELIQLPLQGLRVPGLFPPKITGNVPSSVITTRSAGRQRAKRLAT